MFYNKLVENIIFPVGDALLKTDFISQLKYWRNTVVNKSQAELQQMQRDRLTTLLAHTIDKIPFYKNKKIILSGNPFCDIRQFPVMYKKVIKENINDLFIGDKSKMVIEKSSGSSGIQGEVYMSRKENIGYQAVQTFLWEWSGYRLGFPIMQTGMTLNRTGIKGIKDKVLRTHYVHAYNLSYDLVVKNLLEAKKLGCMYFGGYASSLNVYAETAMKAGINIKFKGVISWGDKLFDHYKTNIIQAFDKPVITELYGSTEGFVIAGTCNFGNYHILTPQVYLELLDKDGNEVAPGELGFVVVTRLDAFHFPLIRYYLGDLAIKENEAKQCPCGRHFPLLKKVVGRDTDIVHTPSGKPLIVHFFTGILEHFPGIRQFRVVQRTPQQIEIEYVPTSAFQPQLLKEITTIMHERAGETFPVNYIQVNHIAPTASGKPQIVLNTIVQKLHHIL